MNINKFDNKLDNLCWERKRFTTKAMGVVEFELPYHTPSKWTGKSPELDWRGTTLIQEGWISRRVNSSGMISFTWLCLLNIPGTSVWNGLCPLLLEFPEIPKIINNQSFEYLATPHGWPGSNATILIDRDGEVVPDICYPGIPTVKIYPLNRDWQTFGWKDPFPAIALQFMDGRCTSSSLSIKKWHAYMMRNGS